MTPTSRVRVLIVDDHDVVREALASRLQQEQQLELVAHACNADQGLELVARHEPDVVVLDIDMPGLSSFDAARTIASRWPDIRILFLSAFSNDRYIEQALAVKARAYLTKREPLKNLVSAIFKVASGGVYFSEEVLGRIIIDGHGARLSRPTPTRASLLSPRELEVLRLVARGQAKKEIAQTLHLSVKTVNRHCANMMEKLDIHDRVELSRFAIREGLAEA